MVRAARRAVLRALGTPAVPATVESLMAVAPPDPNPAAEAAWFTAWQDHRAHERRLDRWWDPKEEWGPRLGCVMCGLTVLIERPARRRILALYVASRALASRWRLEQLPDVANGDVIVLALSLLFTGGHSPFDVIWVQK